MGRIAWDLEDLVSGSGGGDLLISSQHCGGGPNVIWAPVADLGHGTATCCSRIHRV